MQFSIIIPCYGRSNELRDAIASCLGQTFSDFEIIVIDDASPSSLEPVCMAFGDLRIRYYRNATNLGVARSRNIGIELAIGEYVSFLDSDDVYLPLRLEELVACIDDPLERPDILFHRQRRILRFDQSIVSPNRLPFVGERLDEYIFRHGNFIQTNSFVVRRNLAAAVKFDPDCKIYEDTKFLLECWLGSKRYEACAKILSIYNDLGSGSRLSKDKRVERMLPILRFTELECSAVAHDAMAAFVAAEVPFFSRPYYVLRSIWNGWRAGVPSERSILYLLRSAIGSNIADRLARWVLLYRETGLRRAEGKK